MLYQLILVVLFGTFHALEGAKCFNDGLWWTNDYLIDVTSHVPTPQACLDLCTRTPDCRAYTWLSGKYVEQHFAESCITYSDIGTPDSCQECISGVEADCRVCGLHLECQVADNLITMVTTSTELECKETCAETQACGYYTWFDSSTPLKNFCFLLTSCGDVVECEGCSSGPPKCHCNGIEYNLLDDPTRNEKHGKLIHENIKSFRNCFKEKCKKTPTFCRYVPKPTPHFCTYA